MVGLVIIVVMVALACAFALYRRSSDGRLQEVAARPAADEAISDVVATLGSAATFVQFSSEVCAPCRAARALLTEISDANEGIAYVDLDAAEHLDLARQYGVTRTPTILVLDDEGVLRHKAVGALRRAEVEALLGDLSDSSAAAA